MPEFPEPAATGFTIYTKNSCNYCSMVKVLLEEENPLVHHMDPFLVSQKEEFLAFIAAKAGTSYKTFPMVFHNGKFVGGFTETRRLLEHILST